MKQKLILAAALIMTTASLMAQQMPPIPQDPEVRIGQLPNGMTYYIRHNEEPKNQVNFYIAQKVGSILEEEDQRGLAHFLEHMCFNGTEHFADNGVIRYCQSIGVQFGPDLNAYTSIDETVYNIDHVPTTIPGAIDSCLLIIHDWADGLSLLAEDIDKERGVIHEEWRTRSNASFRLLDQLMPRIYPGNRYGIRFPIGLMSVVDNFEYDALRRYYRKWYRTDLQGVVVVGDIDVDEIEGKIRTIFGPIQAVENPAERIYFPIEDNKEPIIAMGTDPEQAVAQTYLFIKHDNFPVEMKGNLDYLVYRYAMQLASDMLNMRLSEYQEQPDVPFSYAACEDDQYFIAQTKQSLMALVTGDPARLEEALTLLYREILRAQRNGFTASEYERAKAEMLSSMESTYNNRNKKLSEEYCREFVRNFIEQEPIMSVEQEYMVMNQLLPLIPIEAVNNIFAQCVSDSTNLVVMSMLPEPNGFTYPTESELADALKAVAKEDIAPYVDQSSNEPILAQLPEAGKVVKTKMDKLGYKHLTLSNGVNVYLQPTTLSNDEILLSAFSYGGISLYGKEDRVNAYFASEVASVGGKGNLSVSDMRKALAGKQATVTNYISTYTEGIEANSTIKDLETMFQLIYLQFTDIRKDTAAFTAWKNKAYAIKQTQENEPMVAFQDSLMLTLFNHNCYAKNMTAEDILTVDYDRCLTIARERFSNANDFTFVITGSFDEETLIPLLERYIASLPQGKKESYRNIGMVCAKGNHELTFHRDMEVPMASTIFLYNGKVPYTTRQHLLYRMIERILNITFTEEIREKEGGTYYVVDNAVHQNIPYEYIMFQIFYQTDPARYEYLNGRIEEILNDFAKNGPSEVNIQKVRETLLKEYQQNLTQNKYFHSAMTDLLQGKIDLVTDYESIINSITAEELQKTLAKLLNQKNRMVVVMNGGN